MNEQQHKELWLAVLKASETCGPGESAAMCAAIDKLCDALMVDSEQYRDDAERYRWMKENVKRIPLAWEQFGWDVCIDKARK